MRTVLIRAVRYFVGEQSNLAWLAVSLAFLDLLQISLISSLILIVGIAVLVLSGRILLENAGFFQMGFGAAFVLAGGLFTLLTQLLLMMELASTLVYFLISTTFLAIIAHQFFANRKLLMMSRTASPRELRLAVGITILIFGIRYPWALPFGIPVALITLTTTQSVKRRFRSTTVVVAVILGWALARLLRPEYWWYSYYTTTDAGYFESLSWIGSEWGVSTRPGMIGSSNASYHWLSYVLFGGIAHIAVLPPWDALMKVGVPLLTGTLVSLTLSLPIQNKTKNSAIPIWILPFIAAISWPFHRFDSASFGLLAGLALLSLIMKQRQLSVTGVFPIVLIAITTVVLMISKAPTALVVGAIISVVTALSPSRKSLVAWLYLATFAVVSGLTYLLLFHGRFASQFLFDLAPNRNTTRALMDLLTLPLSTPILIPLLLLAVRFRRGSALDSGTRLAFAMLASSGFVGIFAALANAVLTHGNNFLLPASFYLFIFSLWYVLANCNTVPTDILFSKRINLLVACTISVLLGFAWPVFANRINSSFGVESQVGPHIWEAIRKYFPFLPVWFLIAWNLRGGRKIRNNAQLAIAICVSLCLVVGIQLDGARRVIAFGPSVYNSSPINDAAFPSPDLRDIGTYIRLNTDKGFVLATNDFCCFGESWWKELETGLRAGQTLDPNFRWGGDNHLLVAESRRRVLIQGIAHQGGTPPSAEQVRRMSLSLEFANRPTQSSLDELKESGVDGFVVNLSLTNHQDWTSFAVERYRNEGYVFLEFR